MDGKVDQVVNADFGYEENVPLRRIVMEAIQANVTRNGGHRLLLEFM